MIHIIATVNHYVQSITFTYLSFLIYHSQFMNDFEVKTLRHKKELVNIIHFVPKLVHVAGNPLLVVTALYTDSLVECFDHHILLAVDNPEVVVLDTAADKQVEVVLDIAAEKQVEAALDTAADKQVEAVIDTAADKLAEAVIDIAVDKLEEAVLDIAVDAETVLGIAAVVDHGLPTVAQQVSQQVHVQMLSFSSDNNNSIIQYSKKILLNFQQLFLPRHSR